nr:alpha-glucosidase [Intestinimonas timonensis]
MEKAWWKESVIYQIYPRSFCDSNGDGIGDLPGITEKLDYLKELGINVLWLSPVYRSPNDDNGYDISDYQAIMDEFGTMADFDELLAQAHARGLKIVMDLVVNHTSDEHPWFVESRQSKNSPKRDFYIWREGKNGKEPNNWGSSFSGPAWTLDEATGMYYLHCFSPKQPDLNWDTPQVRQAVFDMMTWWCEKGIDGFRMDVISMISKREGLPDVPTGGAPYGPCNLGCCNGPHVHEYLQEMRQKVLSHYDLLTVGECAGVTIDQAKQYANAQGTELNMVFQFEHVDLDGGDPAVGKWSTRKMDLVALKKLLSRWQDELDEVAWNSLYFCNHDQPRIVSRLGDDSPRYREISAKSIATCLHMMQGTPYVYQGEELGMTNAPFRSIEDYRDLESINAWRDLSARGVMPEGELMAAIAYKSRDNARTPFQWDDSPNAGFTTGTPWIMVNPNYAEINSKEQLGRADSVFHYYQKLIALRRRSPDSDLIVYGKYRLILPEDPQLFAYTRTLGDKTLLTVCNLSGAPADFTPPAELTGTSARLLIANWETAPAAPAAMTFQPWQAAVWVLED